MTGQDASPVLIRCPRCQKPTDSIKRFGAPDLVVFLFVFAWWRRATYTACPSCMRKTLGEKMAINIIPANLIWPILAIFWGTQIGRTYARGHSQSVLDELGIRGTQ